VDPLGDGPAHLVRDGERLPERRFGARDEVIPAHGVQVVVHEDVRQALLRLAARSDHLADVQQGRNARGIVEDVPRHVVREPGPRREAVQQPGEGLSVVVRLPDARVFRAPGPDAAPAVLGDPHKALLLLIGPLEVGVATTPLVRLALLDRDDSVDSVGVVDERREHRRKRILPRALAHDDGVPYGVEPVPTNELGKALVETCGRCYLAPGRGSGSVHVRSR